MSEKVILPANAPPPCSAIVLAGGRATRLGGVDKALVPLAGRPLLAHVLARLAPQVDDIVINCNRNEQALARFGHALVRDADASFAGPLAGIAAALPHCRHEQVLVVPCDMPFLPADLHARLAAALTPQTNLALAHDGQRLQPLCLLLRRSLLDALQAALARGEHKVQAFCRAQGAAVAYFETAADFVNLNTPQDLATAEARLAAAS